PGGRGDWTPAGEGRRELRIITEEVGPEVAPKSRDRRGHRSTVPAPRASGFPPPAAGPVDEPVRYASGISAWDQRVRSPGPTAGPWSKARRGPGRPLGTWTERGATLRTPRLPATSLRSSGSRAYRTSPGQAVALKSRCPTIAVCGSSPYTPHSHAQVSTSASHSGPVGPVVMYVPSFSMPIVWLLWFAV